MICASQKIIQKINDREARYEVVMRNLIRRYIMNKSRDKIDEGVTGIYQRLMAAVVNKIVHIF